MRSFLPTCSCMYYSSVNYSLWKKSSRVEIRRQQENQYKGDSNEHFKQPACVGCKRTSRKTCRKEFKKARRAVFGRDAKESESGVLADQFGASRFIDLDDPRTFDEALKNVTGIFLITGYTVDMLVQSKTLIDAPAKRLIMSCTWAHLRDATPTRRFSPASDIEAYLRDSGVHTITSQHVYAEFAAVAGQASVQRIHFQTYGVYSFGDVAAQPSFSGRPERHSGKTIGFSTYLIHSKC